MIYSLKKGRKYINHNQKSEVMVPETIEIVGIAGLIGLVAIRQLVVNMTNDIYEWSAAKLSRSNEDKSDEEEQEPRGGGVIIEW